ncbi:MAG: hypothetical protein H6810_03575 [Phycisphaeraceae bacterium]|nr:MAG: hypothetical protein H6810_03575 [Phycisphaeraceae bacterium]
MGLGGPPGGGKQGADFETDKPHPVDPEALAAERAAEAASAKPSDTGDAERIKALEARVVELERALGEAQSSAEAAVRRAEIERALTEAGAIDLEITTPLVEEVVSAMEEPDIGKAVREVRAGKSFLFRGVGGGVASEAMAGESASAGPGLDDLASEARDSGDRGDLLRYLRARRH